MRFQYSMASSWKEMLCGYVEKMTGILKQVVSSF